MFALIAVLILALACATAVGQQVDDGPPESLPPMLQQPEYAAPVLEPMTGPFQEIECADECVECGPLLVQDSYWYAGVDVLATRFRNLAYQTNWDEPAVAVRPYLGWERDSGIGIRGRWWMLEAEGQAVVPHYYHLIIDDSIYPYRQLTDVMFSAASFDLEFYRRFYYDTTSFALGVGTKAVSIDGEYGPYTTEQTSAGGVGAFAEGRHPLYVGSKFVCSFIGYARLGLLTGEVETRYETLNGWSEPQEYDLNMSTTDIGFGLELTRAFQRWDFVFQVVSEVQRWELQNSASRDLSFDSLALRFGGEW